MNFLLTFSLGGRSRERHEHTCAIYSELEQDTYQCPNPRISAVWQVVATLGTAKMSYAQGYGEKAMVSLRC